MLDPDIQALKARLVSVERELLSIASRLEPEEIPLRELTFAQVEDRFVSGTLQLTRLRLAIKALNETIEVL